MARLVIDRRTDGRWHWTLHADNERIVATDGSQGYENRGDATEMAERVVGGAYRDAEVVVAE